jgi:conjugative relaxase-like TrwC/TraI family protein
MSECGYEIEPRNNGQFELKGYAELLETFSTRRQQIEEHLAPIEAPTLKQREHAALTTRQAKVQIAAEVLSQRWEEMNEAMCFGAERQNNMWWRTSQGK